MTGRVDIYWSFRSPYCYLAGERLLGLPRDYDVECVVRPVYPLALRIEGYFKRQNPLHRPYFFRDIARVAEFNGLPLEWPSPDPVTMSFETGDVPAEQPHIHRLTSLGVAAARRARGLEFVVAVSRLLFGGTRGWDQGDLLAQATASADLDLAEMDSAVAADPQGHIAEIEANQFAHAEAGHWGVPLMVFENEPFFGQDRIELLAWRLARRGLARA